MQAGSLRHVAVIERPGTAQVGRTTNLMWYEVARVRVAVRPQSGREQWYAGQMQSEATVVIEMRGPEPRVHPKDRIRVDGQGRTYEVVAVRETDARGRWVTVDAKEATG